MQAVRTLFYIGLLVCSTADFGADRCEIDRADESFLAKYKALISPVFYILRHTATNLG